MSEIPAKLVMQLRNKTGLSMMECKQALQEAGGDMDKAEDLLRKKLKGKMETRMDRAAGEGRVAVKVAPNHTAAAIVEIRAETDFTAKNENFIAMVGKVAEEVMHRPSGAVPADEKINALVDEVRIATGENCSYARGHKLGGAEGRTVFGSYVHHDGKTGVLIQAEGSVSEETLRQIGMHITAAMPRPLGVTPDDIPANLVEKEKKFRLEQAMESGKPKEIAEKMVEGGMRKFYEENALLEQPFVINPETKVKDLLGAKGQIVAFFRWQVGETSS